jgi:integrase
LVKLSILTGQRRDEVAGMCWSELDLESALWKLPPSRTKNGKAYDVPLSRPALEVLAGLSHIGDEFVLTTTGTAPASNFSCWTQRLPLCRAASCRDHPLNACQANQCRALPSPLKSRAASVPGSGG